MKKMIVAVVAVVVLSLCFARVGVKSVTINSDGGIDIYHFIGSPTTVWDYDDPCNYIG